MSASARIPDSSRTSLHFRKVPNKRHRNASLNYLVSAAEHRLRNCEAEHLGSLEIDDHLDLRRPLDRQIGGFRTTENAAGIVAGLLVRMGEVGSVANQASRRRKRAKL